MNIFPRIRLVTAGLCIFALVTMISPTGIIHASGIWYVTSSGDDSYNCTSPSTSCATINGAIDKASPGDTINIAGGSYTGVGSEAVVINKDITLSGGWNDGFVSQGAATIINGENARRGISVNNGVSVTVDRFIVQNGYVADGCGGGILNNGILMLNDSSINNNVGASGGGICNEQGTLTLNRSTLNSNTAR